VSAEVPDAEGAAAFPDRRNQMAEERTALANERTVLAWFRTATTAYALAVAFGNIVPALRKAEGATSDLYLALGISFALLGVYLALDGLARYERVQRQVPDVLADSHGEAMRVRASAVVLALLGGVAVVALIVGRFT